MLQVGVRALRDRRPVVVPSAGRWYSSPESSSPGSFRARPVGAIWDRPLSRPRPELVAQVLVVKEPLQAVARSHDDSASSRQQRTLPPSLRVDSEVRAAEAGKAQPSTADVHALRRRSVSACECHRSSACRLSNSDPRSKERGPSSHDRAEGGAKSSRRTGPTQAGELRGRSGRDHPDRAGA